MLATDHVLTRGCLCDCVIYLHIVSANCTGYICTNVAFAAGATASAAGSTITETQQILGHCQLATSIWYAGRTSVSRSASLQSPASDFGHRDVKCRTSTCIVHQRHTCTIYISIRVTLRECPSTRPVSASLLAATPIGMSCCRSELSQAITRHRC